MFTYCIDTQNPKIENIRKEISRLQEQIDSITDKFSNIVFMTKAPKDIIDKEIKKYFDFSFKQKKLMELCTIIEFTKFDEKYESLTYGFTERATYCIPIRTKNTDMQKKEQFINKKTKRKLLKQHLRYFKNTFGSENSIKELKDEKDFIQSVKDEHIEEEFIQNTDIK